MKVFLMRIRNGTRKAFAAINKNRIAVKVRGSSTTAINRITQGNAMKTITMIVLGLIATASLIMMIIFTVWISHLATSAFEETESSDVTYKVEVADMSPEAVARLVPLVQVFSGDSFIVKGTTDLDPGITTVNIPGIDIDLNENTDSQDSVEASGWAFTQWYTTPDNITSEAILSDNSDNNIIFTATRPNEYENPSEPSDYIIEFTGEYYSIFALLGFDVSISPPSITGNQLQVISAVQEGTVVEVRVWIDPGDTDQVNIALLKSTPEDISIAEADFDAFAALMGGA